MEQFIKLEKTLSITILKTFNIVNCIENTLCCVMCTHQGTTVPGAKKALNPFLHSLCFIFEIDSE